MKETKKALTGAGGFIRRELAAKLNLRVTPELTFVPDGSIEYGANISRLINEIHTTQKPYVPKEDETDSEE